MLNYFRHKISVSYDEKFLLFSIRQQIKPNLVYKKYLVAHMMT